MKIQQPKEVSIKVKRQSIKQVCLSGAKAASEQVEGGEELEQAVRTAYVLAKPGTAVMKAGAKRIRKKAQRRKERRRKEREWERQEYEHSHSKTSHKKGSSGEKEKGQKEGRTEKEHEGKKKRKKKWGIRQILRESAGYLFQKRNPDQEGHEQESNLLQVAVSSLVSPLMGSFAVVLVIAFLIAAPILLLGIMAYQTPWSIYLPSPGGAETVSTVTSEYLMEFEETVHQLVEEHAGHDAGKIVFVGTGDENVKADNYYDIIGVYMTIYGNGNQATVMEDITKEWLRDVVNDMCVYTTKSIQEEYVAADGTTVVGNVLCVEVERKDYRKMIEEYRMSDSEAEWLENFMQSEYPENLKPVVKEEASGDS